MSGFLDFLDFNKSGAQDLNVLGGILQFAGTISRGQQAQAAGQFQADQLRQNGGQAQAAAQRTAADVQRQTEMVVSRSLAVAAASGGGASDPTVINLIAQNASEGAYRKAVALYGGDEANRTARLQADAKEYEGKSARMGSLISGATNLLNSQAKSASMFQRFGGGGPAMYSNGKSGAGPS